MELKTTVRADAGRQDLTVTREFDLPPEWLFEAFVTPELVAQWMGTKVLKLEAKKHGGFQFETTGPKGNSYGFHGVIHELSPNRKIIRTFEMADMPFGVQLEVLEFEGLGGGRSRLRKHVIYESAACRDENLKLPFAQGINYAHNRLQEVVEAAKAPGH